MSHTQGKWMSFGQSIWPGGTKCRISTHSYGDGFYCDTCGKFFPDRDMPPCESSTWVDTQQGYPQWVIVPHTPQCEGLARADSAVHHQRLDGTYEWPMWGWPRENPREMGGGVVRAIWAGTMELAGRLRPYMQEWRFSQVVLPRPK